VDDTDAPPHQCDVVALHLAHVALEQPHLARSGHQRAIAQL